MATPPSTTNSTTLSAYFADVAGYHVGPTSAAALQAAIDREGAAKKQDSPEPHRPWFVMQHAPAPSTSANASAGTSYLPSSASTADGQFARFLGVVQERNFKGEPSITIFTSGRGSTRPPSGKRGCYERGLRVPFFLKHVGVAPRMLDPSLAESGMLLSFVDV